MEVTEQRILEVLQEMLFRGGKNAMDWACGKITRTILPALLREAFVAGALFSEDPYAIFDIKAKALSLYPDKEATP
jgi:hypothetical protein